MNSDLLLTHFDRISEAPDAIPRLRSFVLDLAVRGKLVEQDPKDEHALELLKRIQAEKARLLEEGKIKWRELRSEISPGEIDYPLPANWHPVRIGDLLTVIRGASPRPKGDPQYFSAVRTPYHWIKISDIRKHSRDKVLYDTDEFLTEAGMEKSVLLPKGTLVVTNSATIGVPVILGFEGGCIHDGYLAFPYFPASELSKDFFFILFQTLQSYAAKKARGMAQLNLNTELVREFPIGLPPLAEQRRIMIKVDELMRLCDGLEAAQRDRESRSNQLTTATYHHLISGVDVQNPREHAEFFVDHLPSLTTRPHQIKQLRQTILQLAIRGQLVAQNSKDESARELLNKIRAEKEVLLRKGEIKKEKISKVSANGGRLFEIPPSWEWVSLGDVAFSFKYGTSVKCSYEAEGEPVLRIPNIRGGQIDLQDMKYGPLSEREINDLSLRLGDLLMVRSNGSLDLVGRAAIVDAAAVGYCYAGYLVRVRTDVELVDTQYLLLALTTRYVRDQIEIPIRSAVGLKNVNTSELSSLRFPIAPLAEQHRIVARVDELMTICDSLESQINEVQAKAGSLLESVLFDSLSNTESVGSGHQAIRS